MFFRKKTKIKAALTYWNERIKTKLGDNQKQHTSIYLWLFLGFYSNFLFKVSFYIEILHFCLFLPCLILLMMFLFYVKLLELDGRPLQGCIYRLRVIKDYLLGTGVGKQKWNISGSHQCVIKPD